MSGGVDSSVAALMMKKNGYECIGVTMKLYDNGEIGVCSDHTCCSVEDSEDARGVASKLGMPFYVYNFADKFREDVIERFVDAYLHGRTPNPYIDCNRYLKFAENEGIADKPRSEVRRAVLQGARARLRIRCHRPLCKNRVQSREWTVSS